MHNLQLFFFPNSYTASQIVVRAGSSLDYSGGTVVYVNSIYIHPDHTTTYDYDLAIIKFTTALTLSTSIGVVSLPSQGQAVSLVSTAALTGWGGPSTYCSEYTQLQYAAITIYSQSYCQTNYPNDLINERLICTEYTSGDSTATCIVSCWELNRCGGGIKDGGGGFGFNCALRKIKWKCSV